MSKLVKDAEARIRADEETAAAAAALGRHLKVALLPDGTDGAATSEKYGAMVICAVVIRLLNTVAAEPELNGKIARAVAETYAKIGYSIEGLQPPQKSVMELVNKFLYPEESR